MKNLIPWLCAALLGVGAAYFYTADTTKTDELSALRRREAQEVRTLRAELDSARAGALAQNEDINKLKKESNEAVRLRNELRLVREEKQKLDQQLQAAQSARDSAQQEVTQLRTANEQLQASAKKNEEAVQRYNEMQKQQMRSACLSQLRQIDLAKQQWALENHEPAEAIPTAQDIGLFIRDHVIPVCPAGGAYDFSTVGKMPTCSVPGHTLFQTRAPAK
jgi:hypothetical protein